MKEPQHKVLPTFSLREQQERRSKLGHLRVIHVIKSTLLSPATPAVPRSCMLLLQIDGRVQNRSGIIHNKVKTTATYIRGFTINKPNDCSSIRETIYQARPFREGNTLAIVSSLRNPLASCTSISSHFTTCILKVIKTEKVNVHIQKMTTK